ncbi:MAG: hypothetical protein ACXACU_04815 [Candidatus Hodarchaeales archaeon]|jgi:DNA-binding transcriptional regulator GbsR (MarR family)
MNSNKDSTPFLQIKIDYISYMIQIFKLMAYEETITGILFALMIEGGKYLTQEDIEYMTGFSRSTISEALSKVTIITQDFPIYYTRKPGDKKKYYYCPITFKEYVTRSFLVTSDASKLSMDFIPGFLNRLNALSTQNPSLTYVKRFLVYMYAATSYYELIMLKSDEFLDTMFDDPSYEPKFSELIDKITIIIPEEGYIPSNDTFHQIKKDFIRKMASLSTELLGGNEELISVFLALMLEKDPVTQDELINMTGSSRSNVSKVLTMMEELNVLEVIKKPKIRKKYYNSNTTIEEYGLGKRKRVQGYYAQIQMMMQKKFLPDLEQIEPISEEDTAEKERLTKFFNENFNFFNIFIRYSNAMHTTVQKVLKEFVESYLS